MIDNTCMLCYDITNNDNIYCSNCILKWFKLNECHIYKKENKDLINLICEEFNNL